MRCSLIFAAILTLLMAPQASASESQLEQLKWLAGCWASESGEPGSGEQWSSLAGGTMLGMGRTIRNGQTVEHEFLQIRLDAQGKVVYIASPSRQKETIFVASNIGEGTATFENPAHDYPQRILYRMLPDDRLVVRIEGLRGEAVRGIDFPMKRVPCGTQ
jgi:hypothetical protein